MYGKAAVPLPARIFWRHEGADQVRSSVYSGVNSHQSEYTAPRRTISVRKSPANSPTSASPCRLERA